MRKLLYPIIYLLVLLLPIIASAQKMGVDISPDDAFAFRKAVCSYNKVRLPTGDVKETAANYIKGHTDNFKNSDLEYQDTKNSPYATHLTYGQSFEGIAIFNAQVKVTVDKKNVINSIIDNSYPTSNWGLYDLPKAVNYLQSHDNTAAFMATQPDNSIARNELVIAVIRNQPAVFRLLETYNMDRGNHSIVLIDENGNVTYNQDQNRYSNNATVTATATPFVPDPLTTANVNNYGSPYINDSDRDVSVLNAQRKQETIFVTLNGGVYTLKNDRIGIAEFSMPSTSVMTSTTADFSTTRHQLGFEEVNIMYHIGIHNAHIAALGYDTLANFYTRADAHALSGDDNSQFTRLPGGAPSLFFGDGGVNDAEDADVIVHEYSHAVSDTASHNGNSSGNERLALDEGMADYFATSYSRSLYEFRWADMFTWDGHNEFWNGRTATSSLHYPEGLGNSIHTNGQMWCTAIMQLWSYLGRDATDKLMLQTLYSWGPDITFTDAAHMFRQSDSLITGGLNSCLITTVFYNHGFFDSTDIPSACSLIGINEVDLKQVKVINTNGFATRNEPVMVENNGLGTIEQIELFDATGKTLISMDHIKEQITYISPKDLAKGIYLLKVYANSQYTTFKLVKANE